LRLRVSREKSVTGEYYSVFGASLLTECKGRLGIELEGSNKSKTVCLTKKTTGKLSAATASGRLRLKSGIIVKVLMTMLEIFKSSLVQV
jgi:hypothetical protein